jgi:hypothetical protein
MGNVFILSIYNTFIYRCCPSGTPTQLIEANGLRPTEKRKQGILALRVRGKEEIYPFPYSALAM